MEVITIALKLITPPSVEPVSLAEAILHLRADSSTLADAISVAQSIVPGSHAIAAAYSLEGTAQDVLAYDALVILDAGSCGAGGSVAVKLQHRDDAADAWEDVPGGAFAIITEANDGATQELAYTGGKRYIRAVAAVAGAACEFGVSVLKYAASVADSGLIEGLITAAREYAEGFQNRQYITATWGLWLDGWPRGDRITVPLPPLQSVASVKYYGTDDTEYTLAATEYTVDDKSEPGKLFLRYGKTWPSITLRPHNGVCVEFVAGYGATGASVPEKVKQAMKLLIGHWYRNREAVITGVTSKEIEFAVKSLLWLDRVVPL